MSGDYDSMYSTVVNAIQVVHDVFSTQDNRDKAQQYLDQFKDQLQPDRALTYAVKLVDKSHDERVRHFGLQVMDHIVNKHWNAFSPENKNDLRDMLLRYISNGMMDMVQERRFIKEKVATLVVEIIKREWPQMMPNLLDSVINLANIGQSQCEMVLLIIKALSQDLSNEFASGLIPSRKNDIINALGNALLAKIFQFILQLFEQCYGAFNQAKQQNDISLLSVNKQMLIVLIETSRSLLDEWVQPRKKFFEYKFVNIWCTLLQEPDFRFEACQCLLTFCSTKWKDDRHIGQFLNMFVSSIAKAIGQTFKDMQAMIQEQEFHLILSMIIHTFGTVILPSIPESEIGLVDNFCEMMMAFSNHPSLSIFANMIPLWASFYSPQSKLNKNLSAGRIVAHEEFFAKYHEPFAKICSNKSMKEIANPDNKFFENHPTNVFSQLEADKEEYVSWYGSMRGKLRQCIADMTAIVPMITLQAAFDNIQAVLPKTAPDANKEPVNKRTGHCTVLSLTYLEWENASSFFEWVISALKDDMRKNPQLIQNMQSLFNILLNFSTDDPLIQTRYLHIIGFLKPLYNSDSNSLNLALEKLFQLLPFRTKAEANLPLGRLSEDTVSARRKATTTLIAICRGLSKLLLPSLNLLVERAEKLWNEKLIFGRELIQLYEAFVVVSNQIEDYEQQSKFLSYLLSAANKEWHGEQLSQVIQSEELLLKGVGVLPEQDRNKQDALNYATKRICYILTLFYSVSKRMPETAPSKVGIPSSLYSTEGRRAYPISPFLLDIIPSIMNLVRTLHGIYNPRVMNSIPQGMREPLHIGPIERAHLLNEYVDKSTFRARDHAVWKMRTDLKEIRTYSYCILADACRFCEPTQFWFNEQLLPMLSNSVFTELTNMDNSDMVLLLQKFMRFFVENCPPQLYEQFLGKTLQPLLSLITDRLMAAWSELIARENGVINIGASEKDEVVQDRILRELTRATMSTITRMVECLLQGKTGEAQELTPLCQFILSNDNVLYTCMILAIRLLNIPDNPAARYAISFLHETIVQPTVVGRPKYYALIGGELLQCAIRALMSFTEDMHPILINLITAIVRNYNHRTSHVRQIMLQVPQVTEARFELLIEETTVATEKAGRTYMRKFLHHVLGAKSGAFRKEPKTILNLPPMPRNSDKNLVDRLETVDVGNLFEQ